jgi:hypothetical protein
VASGAGAATSRTADAIATGRINLGSINTVLPPETERLKLDHITSWNTSHEAPSHPNDRFTPRGASILYVSRHLDFQTPRAIAELFLNHADFLDRTQ